MNHSTVSRALNDRSHVSAETRRRVREMADELGYVANLSARMMRGDGGLLIGLLIPDVQNDFYSRVSKELADRCRGVGLRLLLAISEDDPFTEESEIRALVEARVNGVIVTLTSRPQPASLAMLKEMPTVQLVRHAKNLKKAAVCMEDEAGCRAATDHLLALGHRRVAYIGTTEAISSGHDRVRGFLNAHKLRKIAPLPGGVELVPPRQAYGYDGAMRLLALKHPPTALVIGSSALTIGALSALRRAGLQIPANMSVVGYGDPVWFELLSPALTAVRLPVAALAHSAAQQLFAQIEAYKMGKPRRAGSRGLCRNLLCGSPRHRRAGRVECNSKRYPTPTVYPMPMAYPTHKTPQVLQDIKR